MMYKTFGLFVILNSSFFLDGPRAGPGKNQEPIYLLTYLENSVTFGGDP